VRILLVEDDTLLGEGIRVGLRQDGYAVDWVTRGEAAEQALATDAFDLVVLDLGLPGRDGLSVLQHLRQAGDDTPVIILTARDTVADRIQGLDGGADDYLIKPFDLDELAARARALIRRSKGRTTPLLEFGRLTLDPASHQVITARVRPVAHPHGKCRQTGVQDAPAGNPVRLGSGCREQRRGSSHSSPAQKTRCRIDRDGTWRRLSFG